MDPRHCSIPQNVVAAVNITGVIDRGPPGARLPYTKCSNYTVIVLVKNGRLLLVQSEDIPASDAWRTMSYDDAMADHRAHEARLSQRLSIVASVIDTIEFEKSQFAVLVSDAQQTRLDGFPEYKNQTYMFVDFFTPFSIANRWRVQQMITIIHLMEKLKIDITYEPLAIVLRGTEILGLVMSRVEGRLLEMRDRSLVHGTLAKLHGANIMFESGIAMGDFLVHKSKLRLTQRVESLVQYLPGDKERDRLEASSWQQLGDLFDELPRLDTSLIVDVNRSLYKPTLLNYIFSPEPLIFRIIYGPALFANKNPQHAAKKKKSVHSSNSLLKLNAISGSMKYRPTNSPSKSNYHPYSDDGTNNFTLLISNELEIGRHTSDKHNRRKASSVVVRAVSVASDHTLVDVDDDATTVIGDDERWKF
ncbi:hypothetical protein LENED_008717 [Lentinula edodes]|uniref:Uncharacterized protein n=1 Tax=Lentinula edodes TaxID=5353 RepID=A0A1Q3EHV3_LENED|nr:hypothetical protein LENED_008717 [Lentinula edodes]